MKIYIKSAAVKTKGSIQNNLDEWGQSADTNILFILGQSGSGKSTKAKELAQKYNADIIHLDTYFHERASSGNSASASGSSASFQKYCESNLPDYTKLKSTRGQITPEEYKQIAKEFEQTILDYGAYMYGKGKRVIVEGAQLMGILFPNKSFFKSVPTLLLSTNQFVSNWRGAKRDNVNPLKYITNIGFNRAGRQEYKDVKRALK